MKLSRVTSAVLFSFCLSVLSACSGEETTTEAGSTPAASAAATATAAPSSPAADAGSTGAKELCAAADKAGEAMKAELITAMKAGGGNPTAESVKKILTTFADDLAKASAAGDGDVAAAVKSMGEAAKAAAGAASPIDAAAEPSFEKAGSDLAAACKAAGATTTF